MRYEIFAKKATKVVVVNSSVEAIRTLQASIMILIYFFNFYVLLY